VPRNSPNDVDRFPVVILLQHEHAWAFGILWL